MYSKFIVISQLAREIIDIKKVCTSLLKKITSLKDLLNVIYDTYPKIRLFHDEDYKIYWRYSETEFLEIFDHFSLLTGQLLKNDINFYLVIRDVDDWDWQRRNGMVDEFGALQVIAKELEKLRFYTNDERQWFQMIKDMRKGYPRTRTKMLPTPDDKIPNKPALTPPKPVKGKKGKGKDKGKKGGKGKGKKK